MVKTHEVMLSTSVFNKFTSSNYLITKDDNFSMDVYIYKNDEKIITKTLSSSGSYYTEDFEFEKFKNMFNMFAVVKEIKEDGSVIIK